MVNKIPLGDYNFLNPNFFEILPDEIVLRIFLQSIGSSSFEEAKKTYFNGQWTSRRFRQLFNDSSVITSLLSKSHLLPLSIIRRVLHKNPYLPILSKTYECKLADVYQKKYQLSDALAFLWTLNDEERELITYVSLAVLRPPRFYELKKDHGTSQVKIDTASWNSELISFLKLLPGLKAILAPFSMLHWPICFFKILNENAPHVTSLELCSFSLNPCLNCMVPSLTKLDSIFMTNCPILTNLALNFLLSHGKSIRTLALDETPLIHLEELIFPNGLNLKTVVLQGKNFNKESIHVLIKRFPELESLAIANTCSGEETIREILKSSLPLYALDLSHLPVKETDFYDVSPCLSAHLRSLKLYGCETLSDKSALTILKAFPHLEHLDIRYCDITLPDQTQQERKVEILS